MTESEDIMPSWSPDGSLLLYVRRPGPTDPASVEGLYVIDTLGTPPIQIYRGFANNPDWSPTTPRIAFSNGQLFTVTTAGEGLQELTPIEGFFPSWSPDGGRIACDSRFGDSRGAHAIWIAAADGSELHDITTHGGGGWRNPDWSPDGKSLVHLRVTAQSPLYDVFVMDTSGLNPVRLTSDSYDDRDPSWSPDGQWIAWTSIRRGTYSEVWIVHPDGTGARAVTDGLHPAWSLDSKQIAYSRSVDGGTRIFLTDLSGTRIRQITR